MGSAPLDALDDGADEGEIEGAVEGGGAGGLTGTAEPQSAAGDGGGSAGKMREPVASWSTSAADTAKNRTPRIRKKRRARCWEAGVGVTPHVVQKLVMPLARWKACK